MSDVNVAFNKTGIDYSVYLVTGRELLPPGVDYYDSLDRSLRDGHVTVVQIRYVTDPSSPLIVPRHSSSTYSPSVQREACRDQRVFVYCAALARNL